MIYCLAQIAGRTVPLRAHLLEDDCDLYFLDPGPVRDFLRQCFTHLGAEASAVRLVPRYEYEAALERRCRR